MSEMADATLMDRTTLLRAVNLLQRDGFVNGQDGGDWRWRVPGKYLPLLRGRNKTQIRDGTGAAPISNSIRR